MSEVTIPAIELSGRDIGRVIEHADLPGGLGRLVEIYHYLGTNGKIFTTVYIRDESNALFKGFIPSEDPVTLTDIRKYSK